MASEDDRKSSQKNPGFTMDSLVKMSQDPFGIMSQIVKSNAGSNNSTYGWQKTNNNEHKIVIKDNSSPRNAFDFKSLIISNNDANIADRVNGAKTKSYLDEIEPAFHICDVVGYWKKTSRMLNLSIDERGITDMMTLLLAQEGFPWLEIKKYTQREEGYTKKTGADFSLFLGVHGEYIPFLLQAKSMEVQNNQLEKYHYKIKQNQNNQIINYAKSHGMIPLYCFYNDDNGIMSDEKIINSLEAKTKKSYPLIDSKSSSLPYQMGISVAKPIESADLTADSHQWNYEKANKNPLPFSFLFMFAINSPSSNNALRTMDELKEFIGNEFGLEVKEEIDTKKLMMSGSTDDEIKIYTSSEVKKYKNSITSEIEKGSLSDGHICLTVDFTLGLKALEMGEE
jgi:hypothetical protein